LILNLAFNLEGSSNSNYSQKNDIFPLYILFGNDSFHEIGDPKVINSSSGGKDMTGLWEDTFGTLFGMQESDEYEEEDIEKMLKNLYMEARIDEELTNFERRKIANIESVKNNGSSNNKKVRTKKTQNK
jgi:hypothetical protein